MVVTITLATIFGIYAFNNPDDSNCYAYTILGITEAERFKPLESESKYQNVGR